MATRDVPNPDPNARVPSVADAQRLLDLCPKGVLSRPDVNAMGVGIRDGQTTLIVTVTDREAREKVLASEQGGAGLPLRVEIEQMAAAGVRAVAYENAHMKPGLLDRLLRRLRGLTTILAP